MTKHIYIQKLDNKQTRVIFSDDDYINVCDSHIEDLLMHYRDLGIKVSSYTDKTDLQTVMSQEIDRTGSHSTRILSDEESWDNHNG